MDNGGLPKTLKFRQHLAQMILDGKKTSTWRLFDDKDIRPGDEIDFVRWEDRRVFAHATVTKTAEKPLGKLADEDKHGHEKYDTDQEMYTTLRTYYNEPVGPRTTAKLIWFKLRR